ncbi:MAG: guanylate kinase [Nitrospirae bacterium]|nr:guanylate kinase [Nitrospirota bacterium]
MPGLKKGSGISPRVSEGLLFVVSAPSGAGKTSLCKEVIKYIPNIQHSVSYTTRSSRPSETDGTDYHFITEGTFRKMIEDDAFIEWAIVHGNYYGTSKKDLGVLLSRGIDIILDIDSQGAMQIKKRFKNGVFCYVLPPSFEHLIERLTVRKGDTPKEIKRRLKVAREEVKDYRMYDYLIVNDDFDRALGELKAIITSARIKMDRINPAWVEYNFFERRGG